MAESNEERYEREYAAPAREAEARMKARMEELAEASPAGAVRVETPEEHARHIRDYRRAVVKAVVLNKGLEVAVSVITWGLVALVVAPIARRALR